ncbi:YcdB/YcdC domain-containing protein [Desulfosporosinus shakirovi]|uniref:YcdB/YcdC domain-containing protein n=1 Tax=Desulfosporosinus shakirovi TaxID=2885154 RepID=UPI001E297BE1|nr:YcdB/YcdC domain-containing protein [Desulfosporosinus sp. SRJS8]MCB8816729.1 S-layer homology domain-containing protein [Desulfosporosinus sp. SRJS8]
MFRKIRHLNIVVIFILLLQLAVYPVNTLGSEKASITVEQAVQIVKDNFSIPEKYSRMSTGYNKYNDRATYNIDWSSMEQPHGSFNAMVDATTGDILNINQWEESFSPSFKLPVLSMEDAEKKATDLISKLASKYQSEMKLVKDDQQVLDLNNSQPFAYNFRWIRIVDGIPFPGNGVNVSVRGDNGQVRDYNFNWTHDLNFPAASKVISPETARQTFSDTPMLELQYFIPPLMNPEISEPQRVLLVYQLSNNYYGGAVDALSGKPVTLDDQAVGYESRSAVSSISAATSTTIMPGVASQVTEASTSKDSPENSQQISQSEAVEIVKKAIKIPKEFVMQNSSLNPDWQNPSEQVWDLNWNTESFYMGEHRFIGASVNAKTGDLISFHMSYNTKPDDKAKTVTRKEAQEIADDFLKRIQPERFELVKLESERFYGSKIPSYIQMFSYVRVVDGIPVSRNGINLTVDTVAKQVINYNMNWSNIEFPSSADVLPINEATDRFLKMRPLELSYTLIYKQDGQKQEARLVYQPNSNFIMYGPGMINAKTGEPMDWYGKTQSQWSSSHKFTDIQGNYAEKEIGIMALTRAFGEYGDTFRPNEKITAGSLLRAMITLEGNNRDVLADEDVLKIAKERGWLHEDLKLESELSRDDLSKIMIRLIKMEPSAKAQGIYALPFTDANTIKPDSLGYIALAWGLGILKFDGNTLNPNQTVTRAEAAYALVHAYAVEQPQNTNMK